MLADILVENYGWSSLLFADIDSLTYEIASEDVYNGFHEDRKMFDNSDYPEDSPFHFNNNKKVIGKVKDEAACCPIVVFVGVGNKMYSYVKDGNLGGKTAKGVQKAIVKNVIHHEKKRSPVQLTVAPTQHEDNQKR